MLTKMIGTNMPGRAVSRPVHGACRVYCSGLGTVTVHGVHMSEANTHTHMYAAIEGKIA